MTPIDQVDATQSLHRQVHGTHGRAAVVDLSDRTLSDHQRASLDQLHDSWSSASRIRLGFSRQQWFHPATYGLVDAITAGVDLTEALRAIGEARAGAGLSLDETLADLDVLADLLASMPRGRPDHGIDRVDSLRAASVTGTAWAEAFYDRIVAPNCTDPVTGLVTDSYLEARLGQLYHQAARGGRPDRDHVLVVLQINCRDLSPFACVAQRIRAAGAFRAAIADADTIALLEPTHAMVALVENNESLAEAVAAIRVTEPGDCVWVEHLGATADEAVALVRELATIPRTATVASRPGVSHP